MCVIAWLERQFGLLADPFKQCMQIVPGRSCDGPSSSALYRSPRLDAKVEGADREGADSQAELDMAVKQIVAEHISGIDVIDIYAEAGMGQPDLSLIDEDLIDKFRYSDRPNRQIEMLKRLLADEIKAVGKRNLVAGQAFSGMLADAGVALPEPRAGCCSCCRRARRAGKAAKTRG